MIIRHQLPLNCWTKVDKNVFTLDISAGAKVLYGYFCGLQNGVAYTDANLITALGISQQTLTRQKRELKDAGLFYTEQVLPRVYVGYVGHTKKPAIQIKNEWDKEDAIV